MPEIHNAYLPTSDDLQELIRYCRYEWDDARKGMVFTGPNGNSIFLPALGYRYRDKNGSTVVSRGSNGYYWSSSIVDEEDAFDLDFSSDVVYADDYFNRGAGFSVRLVGDEKTAPEGFVDLGLPSGRKWAPANEKGFYSFEKAMEMFGRPEIEFKQESVKEELKESPLPQDELIIPADSIVKPLYKGQDGNLYDIAFTLFEKKEIVSREISANLTAFFRNGSTRSVAAPQDLSGKTYRGENAAYLLACIQSRPDWLPVFLTREEMDTLGVKAYPTTEPVSFIRREAGQGVIRDVVWNIADTTFADIYREEYEKICETLKSPLENRFDSSVALTALNDFRQNTASFENDAIYQHNPHLSESERAAADALVEATLGAACGMSGMMSQIDDMPFKDALATAEMPGRFPAYDIMRHAGRMLESVKAKYPAGYPEQGLNCQELLRTFAARRESLAKEQAESNGKEQGSSLNIH